MKYNAMKPKLQQFIEEKPDYNRIKTFPLHLNTELHEKIRKAANSKEESINQFIMTAIIERMGK